MIVPYACILAIWLTAATSPVPNPTSTLIVVMDQGGAAATPYYRALHLLPGPPSTEAPRLPAPPAAPRAKHYREADFLPVRSRRMSPGHVAPQTLNLPGLSPIFIVGDDPDSARWLSTSADLLRRLRAVGFVVNVETDDRLRRLRAAAPGIQLVPAVIDNFATSIGLTHYPALITPTGIEQ